MIKTKVDMANYKPTELLIPSAVYLVQCKSIEEKTITAANNVKYDIYEITHTILNGTDNRGIQKVLTVNDSIFLNGEYTQQNIYNVFTPFGLLGANLSNPELAIGRKAVLTYTNKEDVTPAASGKSYAKCKYKAFTGQQIQPVMVVGQVHQVPTINAAPMQQPVQPQVLQPAPPVYAQQPVAPAYAQPMQQAPVAPQPVYAPQPVQPGYVQPAPPNYATPVQPAPVQQAPAQPGLGNFFPGLGQNQGG